MYGEDACPKLPCSKEGRMTEVAVTAERSFQAAMRLKKENPEMCVAVHNFASATNPGGGVTRGSNAQEDGGLKMNNSKKWCIRGMWRHGS